MENVKNTTSVKTKNTKERNEGRSHRQASYIRACPQHEQNMSRLYALPAAMAISCDFFKRDRASASRRSLLSPFCPLGGFTTRTQHKSTTLQPTNKYDIARARSDGSQRGPQQGLTASNVFRVVTAPRVAGSPFALSVVASTDPLLVCPPGDIELDYESDKRLP